MGVRVSQQVRKRDIETRAGGQRGLIHRLLQSAILSGGFPAGQMLPAERELMRRYGTTRTTIRRALAKLIQSGHLTCQPRIGYAVPAVFRAGKPVKTHAIGLVTYLASEPSGNSRVLTALERVAADAGHVVMLGSSEYDADREDKAIRRLAAAGMEGLVIAPARVGKRSAELERWIEGGRPVVLHGHPGRWLLPDTLVRRCDIVDPDNADGIRQVVKLLSDMGHKSAGFLCQEALEGSERFAAFKKWAGEFDLVTEPRWWGANCGSPDGGRAALARLQASGGLPTAVACSHDGVALWFIDAMREQGLRCPRDVSVTGFEGQSLRDDSAPTTLTTVDIGSDRRAQETMRLLAKQFAGIKGRPEHVRVPVSLVARGSVAPPRDAEAG